MSSNYPVGTLSVTYPNETVMHVCPACRYRWTAVLYYELGSWFYVNEELGSCPNCGNDEPIVEEEA